MKVQMNDNQKPIDWKTVVLLVCLVWLMGLSAELWNISKNLKSYDALSRRLLDAQVDMMLATTDIERIQTDNSRFSSEIRDIYENIRRIYDELGSLNKAIYDLENSTESANFDLKIITDKLSWRISDLELEITRLDCRIDDCYVR